MRARDKYRGLVWVDTLYGDRERAKRAVQGYDKHTIGELIVTLTSVFGVSVEIRCVGLLWGIRCIPEPTNDMPIGTHWSISYIGSDIITIARAALLDYDDIARGTRVMRSSNREVVRGVVC